jgi:hypothetical protein
MAAWFGHFLHFGRFRSHPARIGHYHCFDSRHPRSQSRLAPEELPDSALPSDEGGVAIISFVPVGFHSL